MNHLHFKRIVFLLFAVSFTLAAVGVSIPSDRVDAALGNDPDDLGLLGYVWSPTIGWISFCGGRGSYNDCSGIEDYRVWVNNDTGDFSGWGWSPNAGWLTFSRTVAGTPPADDVCQGGDHDADALGCADLSTKQGIGWARFIAGCDFDATTKRCLSRGAGPNSGGWDGWVKLGDPDLGAASFSVQASSSLSGQSRFLGYAWGSEVSGYISFDLSSTSSIVRPENVPTIFVSLTRSLEAGRVPFRLVMTAVVSSTSNAPINYKFNCGNATFDFNSPEKTATTTCTYTQPGKYDLSVIVEQRGLIARAQATQGFLTPLEALRPRIIEIPPEELPEDF